MNLRKPLRLFVIGVAMVSPLGLLWRHVQFMATNLDASRLRLLAVAMSDPAGFAIWVSILGLMLHACLCWYRKPTWPRLLYLILTVVGLGSLSLLGCSVTMFFHMPGDGPIP